MYRLSFIPVMSPPVSLWGLPATFGESLTNLSHLGLAHNKMTRLDRSLLESMSRLDSLTLRGNSWKCDCQLIGLKLWLETYVFKGQSTFAVGSDSSACLLCSHVLGKILDYGNI